MYSLLTCNKEDKEIVDISKIFKAEVAYYTDEMLKIITCKNRDEVSRILHECENLDIVCYDITTEDGIRMVETVRDHNKNAYIILIATPDISPLKYMKPSIMAASLLFRPMLEEDIRDVADEALRTFEQESSKEIYVVETEDGKDRIPYSDIIYFESREKKIFCCTRYREYGFYGTLEKLEQELPDHFKRCHRGYILNTAWIRKVALSENTIYLRDDYAIPVSRSYKSIMKEYRG